MKLEVRKYYRIKGGWKTVIIWKRANNSGVYVIHQPKDKDKESVPIFHYHNGKAAPGFSVNEPPKYNASLPADLIEEWKENKK